MTNEEALQILKQYLDMDSEVKSEYLEAQRMAIKALEQQPSEDCISRQAVLRLVEQYPSIIGNRCVGLMADIKHLPPVTPTISEKETVEDCISREAAKEMLSEEWTKYMPMELDINLSFVLEKISELPSVKPQRPKGRWIEQQDIHKHHYGWSFCSECGAFLMSSDGANFCSCCGAEMEAEA